MFMVSQNSRLDLWFLCLIDDCTQFTWTYLMSHRLEAKNITQELYRMIRQFNVSIKKFRTDNAKDFCNTELSHFFSKGVLHEKSFVYSPQQNGVANEI